MSNENGSFDHKRWFTSLRSIGVHCRCCSPKKMNNNSTILDDKANKIKQRGSNTNNDSEHRIA